MSSAPAVLGSVTLALLVAAGALTAFGRRQRRYAGWAHWVAAAWVTALGTLVGCLPLGAVAEAFSAALVMQWPVWALVGLRLFHPRQGPAGRPWHDAAWLGASTLVAFAGLLAGGAAAWLAQLAWLATHVYVAQSLLRGPAGRDFAPGRALALASLTLALGASLLGWPGAGWVEGLVARGVAAALGCMVLAFVAVTLVCERTERQLRDSRRRLRVLANLDTLTQVPNRRHFLELADHALRQDEPGTAALLIFDVDHFKQINDLFGHAAGDRALCLVTRAMLEHLRAHDVPGRQGGDEFVLLLRRTSPSHAMGVAARIVNEVQKRAPQEQLPTVSLSFGVVQIGLGEGIQSAMRRADQALYEAKRQGRSRAVAALGNERRPVFSESQRLGLTPA